MITARIFQRPKSSMQSGKSNVDQWVLQFEPDAPKRADPLTGWAGGGTTLEQITLGFPTRDAAIAYADKQGYAYTIVPAPQRKLKLQAYADNFR